MAKRPIPAWKRPRAPRAPFPSPPVPLLDDLADLPDDGLDHWLKGARR